MDTSQATREVEERREERREIRRADTGYNMEQEQPDERRRHYSSRQKSGGRNNNGKDPEEYDEFIRQMKTSEVDTESRARTFCFHTKNIFSFVFSSQIDIL